MRHFVSQKIIKRIKFNPEERNVDSIVRQLRPDFEYQLVHVTEDESTLSNITLFRKGSQSISIPGKITVRFKKNPCSISEIEISNYFLLLILQKELSEKFIFSEMSDTDNYYDTLVGAREEEELNQALKDLYNVVQPDPRFDWNVSMYLTNLIENHTRDNHYTAEIFRKNKEIAIATKDFLLHPDNVQVQKRYIQAFSQVKRTHELYRAGIGLAIIGGLGTLLLLSLTPFTLGFSIYIGIPVLCACIGIQTCIFTKSGHGFFKEQKSISEPVLTQESVGNPLICESVASMVSRII